MQKQVEELYLDKYKWAEFAIQNIGGMSRFSSDEVINNYAKSIWGIESCFLDPYIFKKVKKEYQEINLYSICKS